MKKKQLINRIIQMAMVLFGISLVTFALTYLSPGDPVRTMYASSGMMTSEEVIQQTREALGLDRSFFVQYWCWLKDDDSLKSVEMSNIKNEILYDLGVREMFFEVDKANTSVYKYHLKVNRAMPVEEITLPNGRVRVMMKKELKRKINDNRKV